MWQMDQDGPALFVRFQKLGGSEASPPASPTSPEDMDPVVHSTLGMLLPFSWVGFQA